MEKIASFTIDHIKLQPGIYVSRKDQIGQEVVTTFDLRMTSPNEEPVMNTAEVHTIEHLGATYLRNKEEIRDKVIYFGPMGCRTGFYLIVRDKMSHRQVLDLVRETLAFINDFYGKIPGADPFECGNFREHNLLGAINQCTDYAEALKDWTVEKMTYPTA